MGLTPALPNHHRLNNTFLHAAKRPQLTRTHTRLSSETFVTEVELNKYWLCVNAFLRLLCKITTTKPRGRPRFEAVLFLYSFPPSPMPRRTNNSRGRRPRVRCVVRFSILSAAAFSTVVVAGEGEIRDPLRVVPHVARVHARSGTTAEAASGQSATGRAWGIKLPSLLRRWIRR